MKKIIAIVAIAMSVAACQPNIPQIPQVPQVLGGEQQQPVQQAQQQDSGMSPVTAGLLGAAGGYFLGKSRGTQQHTTIVQPVAPAPSYNGYSSPYNRPRTTVTTTTVKKGLFGGKTVTRTVRRGR